MCVLQNLKIRKKTDIDSLDCLKKKEKKSKKRKIKDANIQIEDVIKKKKIKTMTLTKMNAIV